MVDMLASGLQFLCSPLMRGPQVAYAGILCALNHGYRRIPSSIAVVLRHEKGAVLKGSTELDSKTICLDISGLVSRDEYRISGKKLRSTLYGHYLPLEPHHQHNEGREKQQEANQWEGFSIKKQGRKSKIRQLVAFGLVPGSNSLLELRRVDLDVLYAAEQTNEDA